VHRVVDMALAALLGVSALFAMGVLNGENTADGNAILIGASSVVAEGICAGHGKSVTFRGFLCYGLPIATLQLAVSALYALVLFLLMH
jgi:hypothetical protein